MSDVFISYAREDRAAAEAVAAAVSQYGWTVWWDRKIQIGRSFSETIEHELNSAKCVLVLWSGVSIGSEWVANEAAEGARRHILVPIRIADVAPPLEFRRLQAATLLDLQAIETNTEFADCIAAIRLLVGGSTTQSDVKMPERPPVESKRDLTVIVQPRRLLIAAATLTVGILSLFAWRWVTDIPTPETATSQSTATNDATQTSVPSDSTDQMSNTAGDTTAHLATMTASVDTTAGLDTTTTAAAEAIDPFPFVPVERYEYRYAANGVQCKGFFLHDNSPRWVERTFDTGGCVDTHYEFVEQSRNAEEILIYDASRNYYIRIPLSGGRTMLASSTAGPWGALHNVTVHE